VVVETPAATTDVTSDVVADTGDSGTSSTRQQVVDYALQFVGNPYVYGGTSLTNGTDCSGFTQSVLSEFGIDVNRTAGQQSQGGSSVDMDSLQPGDLLFYSGSGDYGIGHVSMYIGNDQVVHASNSTDGIIVSDVNYRTPVSAKSYID
ncbi:MAG: C40 family peptidase, partial [Eubacteriales bacterium]|nr:C40 family peptidase [Eubacteriales bacterium]